VLFFTLEILILDLQVYVSQSTFGFIYLTRSVSVKEINSLTK
jgi:hypothetical protein